MKEKLGIQTLRIIGNPTLKVRRICLESGAPGSDPQIKALQRPEVDVLLKGESPEWETASYVRDAAAEGKQKALIVLGHVPSEEAGMEECARWLKTFIKDMPIEFIAAGESYWRLK